MASSNPSRPSWFDRWSHRILTWATGIPHLLPVSPSMGPLDRTLAQTENSHLLLKHRERVELRSAALVTASFASSALSMVARRERTRLLALAFSLAAACVAKVVVEALRGAEEDDSGGGNGRGRPAPPSPANSGAAAAAEQALAPKTSRFDLKAPHPPSSDLGLSF